MRTRLHGWLFLRQQALRVGDPNRYFAQDRLNVGADIDVME